MASTIIILGRFPPPLDGQAMATRRLAELVDERHNAARVNVSAPEEDQAVARVRLRPGRVLHYLGTRGRVNRQLMEHPYAPVLWPSVSPALLGHLRDRLTVLPALRGKRAVYAVVHRGDFHELFERALTRASAKAMIARLAGVVFLTEHLADRCAPWIPGHKRFVIPNTIEEAICCTDEEVAAKYNRRTGNEPLRVLFLSNMIASKGFMDLLAAVKLLRARGVPVLADFAGRWEDEAGRRDFDAYVRQHDLGGVVTHHGGVSDRRRIRALYLAADAFVLPTYYPTEAQPLTIIEAMNAGTPIVATPHAGIPEMVDDGREGLLVAPRNPEAIARALMALAEPDGWRVHAALARARFLAQFSPTAVSRQWEALLDGTLRPQVTAPPS
jgi:glycosyltransferase involved in cell wall biosynthesis